MTPLYDPPPPPGLYADVYDLCSGEYQTPPPALYQKKPEKLQNAPPPLWRKRYIKIPQTVSPPPSFVHPPQGAGGGGVVIWPMHNEQSIGKHRHQRRLRKFSWVILEFR